MKILLFLTVLSLLATSTFCMPVLNYFLDDYLSLSFYPEADIDNSDVFLSHCENDTVSNFYLADIMENQNVCHLSDCLLQDEAWTKPVLEVVDSGHVKFHLAPFLGVVFGDMSCSETLSLAFAGASEFLTTNSSVPIEVRVIESVPTLDFYGTVLPECPTYARSIINIVVPSFCDTKCFDFCIDEYYTPQMLNAAIARYEIRRLREKLGDLIQELLTEQELLLRSPAVVDTVSLINEAIDHRDFSEECLDAFTLALQVLDEGQLRD